MVSDPHSTTPRWPIDITDQTAIVHAICPYLRRRLDDCKKCPEWEEFGRLGKAQRACYSLAQEVMNICQTGHPHRKGDVQP